MNFKNIIKSFITVVFCTSIVLTSSVVANALLNYTVSDLEYRYENQDETRMELIKAKITQTRNLISPIKNSNTLAKWKDLQQEDDKNSVTKIMDDFSLVGKEVKTEKIGFIPVATITHYNYTYADIFEINLPKCMSIGNNAFKNVKSLTTVNMPICEYVGNNAFSNCNELETVNIPKCKAILDETFKSCGNLRSIEMLECESVGYRAFEGCDKLEEVYLPMCKKISTEAFHNCLSLKKITVSKDCQFEEGAIVKYVKIQYINEDNEIVTYEPDVIIETQKPFSEEKKFLEKDEETGILVFADIGVIPNNAHIVTCKLTPENIDNSDENYRKAIENLDEDKVKYIENMDLYSINLIDENANKIQPHGEVTVMLPIDKYFDLSDLEILRITAMDDEVRDSRVVEKDGIKYCAFETNHFSIYCLSDKLTAKEYIEIFTPYVIIFVSSLTAVISYQHLKKIKKHKA